MCGRMNLLDKFKMLMVDGGHVEFFRKMLISPLLDEDNCPEFGIHM